MSSTILRIASFLMATLFIARIANTLETTAQHQAYRVLWISEFGLESEGIDLRVTTNQDLGYVADYKELICQILSTIELAEFEEYSIDRNHISQYDKIGISIYYMLDRFISQIGYYDPGEASEIIERLRGRYDFSRGTGGRLHLVHHGQAGKEDLFYMLDHTQFCSLDRLVPQ